MISAVVGVGQPSFFDLVATAERLEMQDREAERERRGGVLDLRGFEASLEQIRRDCERVVMAVNRVMEGVFTPMYQHVLDGGNATYDDIDFAVSLCIADLNLDSSEDFTDRVVYYCEARWLDRRDKEERSGDPELIEPPAPPPSCALCGEPHYDEPCAEVARLDAEDGSRWGRFEPAVRVERKRVRIRLGYLD
jgi:hypothetical protein